MEQVVEDLENKMKQTDEKMGNLAVQVGNIESEIFSENGEQIEVNDLLKSVGEVKTNYQNLRKELMEVQDLQKQLSSSLHVQLKLMQTKFNLLKEKLPQAPVSMNRTAQNPIRYLPSEQTLTGHHPNGQGPTGLLGDGRYTSESEEEK